MQNALNYIGNGAFIPDLNGELVPARDLNADEVAHFGEDVLLASGLYARPTPNESKAKLKSDAKSG